MPVDRDFWLARTEKTDGLSQMDGQVIHMGSQQSGEAAFDGRVVASWVAGAGEMAAHVASATWFRVIGKEGGNEEVSIFAHFTGIAGQKGHNIGIHLLPHALLADHAKRDWRPVVARVDVPVLFVAGAESEVWPSGHASAAAALNPLAEAIVIERDGHAANIEQPAAFNRILLDWLARSAP